LLVDVANGHAQQSPDQVGNGNFGLKASGGGDDHITLGGAAVLVDGLGDDTHQLAQATVKGVGVGIAEVFNLATFGLQAFAFGVLPELLGAELAVRMWRNG
jgi:hypothetical protein